MAGPIVLSTNCERFERLSREASGPASVRLDEACFWHPRSSRPVVRASPGEIAFFKLVAPRSAIARYDGSALVMTPGRDALEVAPAQSLRARRMNSSIERPTPTRTH